MEVSPDLITDSGVSTTTSTDAESTQAIKESVDAEYENKAKGGSKTRWIMAGLAVALIIIFGIVLLVFFFLWNKPPMHEIAVVNNCSQPINVLVGTETSPTSLQALPIKRLNPEQVAYYYATPAVHFVVQGYYDNTLAPGAIYPYPLTKGLLWFGSNGFNGTTQITDGSTIMNVPVETFANGTSNSAEDFYDISMQDGFNIQIGIESTYFNNKDPSNMFSCVGPSWYYNIGNTGITATVCPDELQYPATGTKYQACMSPCFSGLTGSPQFCCSATGSCELSGGCQNSWPDNDYYQLFYGACPNCMITNCDMPLYQCSSSGGLTQYVITFCPSRK